MKKFSLIIYATLLNSLCYAQSFDQYLKSKREDFSNYVNSEQKAFNEYRDKVNAGYAERLREPWSSINSSPAIGQPDKPEPPKPKIAPEKQEPISNLVPTKEILPPPSTQPDERPVALVSTPKSVNKTYNHNFLYYGTECGVNINASNKSYLNSIDETGVAKYWQILSQECYVELVEDCLYWRDKLALNDWGYWCFIKRMSETYYSTTYENEAKVMQLFILTQSGYAARIANAGNKLFVLLPCDTQLYGYSYIPINGVKYYIVSRTSPNQSYSVFTHQFPKERCISLSMNQEPKLAMQLSKVRSLSSSLYKDATAEVYTNKNLIDFYADFPRNANWALYSQTSISNGVKSRLYPILKQSILNKDDEAAANILLNFVQTSLDYKTDREQFGEERPLFADETLYYPYCDCEDRAILYSVLVRDLLGLDVVLLNYPNHISTAVRFLEQTTGSHIKVGGVKYVICDPSYIGANVGQNMPEYDNIGATIIKLK